MSKQRILAKIDLDAISNNVNELYKHMPEHQPIMAVIKADGYGHGAVPIAKVLEKNEHICGYAVATSEEAIALRESYIRKPILILGYAFEEDYEMLIKRDISMTVFNYDTAVALSKAAGRMNKTVKIHIKIDTGMSRIGFLPSDESIKEIVKISRLSGIEMVGIFTHFARADETDYSALDKQLTIFNDFIDKLSSNNINFWILHCANSASILMHPLTHKKMVRAGIVLYGLKPSDETVMDGVDLTPAMTLVSHIVHLKYIEPGTPVSYGGTFTADKKMKLATVPVGYADGYPRSLSNKGYVLINGKKAYIKGRVCMDQLMVDVTDIDCELFDEVILLGKSGNAEITAEELGELSGRFNYELVCDISPRVPKEYITSQ